MMLTVACIGAGFVGGPLAVVIAYKCPDIRVVVADRNETRIQAWARGSPSFYEPGMNEMLSTVQGREEPRRNLEFVTDVETTIKQADMIFICVDTPTKSFGAGRGCAADLTNIQGVARTIAQVAKGKKVIVEKSTIPCGTGEMLHDLLSNSGTTEAEFEILSNPEFLSEGSAIENLLRPSRVLIGSAHTVAGKQAANSLAALYEIWVPRSSILHMDRWSSELAKLAANAMLAQRISSINSLSAICEAVGANVDSVSTACGLDPRIGPHMLRGGIGWGGGCFQKDILDLVYIARSLHLHDVAGYWESVISMNDWQQGRFVQRIVACMHGSISGRRMCVLGFSFKENTSDTKNSPAISVVRGLLEEGAKVSIYDPQASSDEIASAVGEIGGRAQLGICRTPYEACELADAIVLVTGWDRFRTPCNGSELQETPLDWRRVVDAMQRPKYVFDGRNLLDGSFLTRLGCRPALRQISAICKAIHSLQ
ncbi:hypothetical protein BDW74DRAFT_168409 [Aspergillus multicolor]|uniref:UDP-glucose dehydrogenase n=1 Tax=Aspergillus multicolor TaxID=41759 RepID=UPI003CCE500D